MNAETCTWWLGTNEALRAGISRRNARRAKMRRCGKPATHTATFKYIDPLKLCPCHARALDHHNIGKEHNEHNSYTLERIKP